MKVLGEDININETLKDLNNVANSVRSALTGDISPEKRADMQMMLLMAENKIMQAQIAVNMEEAKSPSLFTSGWRPAVGWVCVITLFYNFIGAPLFHYGIQFFKDYLQSPVPPLPNLDNGELMTLLLGLLGLGGYRSWEKISGVVKSRG